MLVNLNIDLLRAFVTVVDTKSFTKAADRVFRTQPTISLQIKKLEQHSGAVLLERDSRNICMTEEGRKLYAYATKILDLHDQLCAQLSERKQRPSVLRIGIPDDFAHTFLAGVFEAVREWSPDVEIVVTSDVSCNLRELIDQGELDLAIVTSERPDDDAKLLRQEKLRWVCGNSEDVAARTPVPMALFGDGCIFRRRALKALDQQKRPWTVVHSSNSFSGLLAMLKSGNAISVLAESSVDEDLIVLDDEKFYPDLGEVTIRMVQSANFTWPKVNALVQIIETVLNKSFNRVAFIS